MVEDDTKVAEVAMVADKSQAGRSVQSWPEGPKSRPEPLNKKSKRRILVTY